MGKIAEVLVDLAAHEVDRPFHYRVPAGWNVTPGQAVAVPFGRRRLAGLVVNLVESSPLHELKELAAVIYGGEPLLTAEQLQLARKLADYYLCPLVLILRQMIPFPLTLDQGRWVRAKQRQVLVPLVDDVTPAFSPRATAQRDLWQQLLVRGEIPLADCSRSAAQALEKRGLARIVLTEERRNPLLAQVSRPSRPLTLNQEQQAALEEMAAALESESEAVFLLHGVTGSGKTEVYLQLIDKVLSKGKQCLMLVPEISLTPQMVERFTARFGSAIALWHSALSAGERFDEWRRIKTGEARIIIGARSAIFAPCHDLGIIIMDEEHEGSYRQDENPRYHTRVVAQFRQKTTGCLLVMGSATPSFESYYAASQNRCRKLVISQRVEERPLPPVRLVDMRAEYRLGRQGLISGRLEEAINSCLARQEQIILLLNRRGFSSYLLCPMCGYVPFCNSCDISLTYHHFGEVLRCHYCSHTQRVLHNCPDCGSDKIKGHGIGTQQLEKTLAATFSEGKILRMDADTASGKNAHHRLLQSFASGEYNILVGTQMIAKGLDFPKVTLVGVVSADTGLYVPDFRAPERTFQLLAQVAGRAGRGSRPGEVIIQTFNPEQYVFNHAKNHDYTTFFAQELRLRAQSGYPPLGHMITLFLTYEQEDKLVEDAAWLVTLLEDVLAEDVDIVGPSPCPVSRIRNSYRWQIIVKGRSRTSLRAGVAQALETYRGERRPTSVILDFDA